MLRCRFLPQWLVEAHGGCRMEYDVAMLDQRAFVSGIETKVGIENVALQRDDLLFEIRMDRSSSVEELTRRSSDLRRANVSFLPHSIAILSSDERRRGHVSVEQEDKCTECLMALTRGKINRRDAVEHIVPGQERTSFSTNCLPMNPVAPVMKTDFPRKNSAIALVDIVNLND